MEGYKTENMVMPFYRFVLLLSNTVCCSGHAVCIKNSGEWHNVLLNKRIIERLGWSLYEEKIRSFRIHFVKYD